jgi:hypothetical protein
MSDRHRTLLSVLSVAFGIALGYVSTSGSGNSGSNPKVNIVTNKDGDPGDTAIGESTKSDEDEFTHLLSALRDSGTLKGRADLYRALAHLRTADVAKLMDRAQKLPVKLRNELSAGLFEHWLEIDRPMAEAWIREELRSSGCYEAWARSSPQEALDHLFKSSWSNSFWSAAAISIDRLAGKDPHARVDLVARYPQSFAVNHHLGNEFSGWARSDPESALSWAAKRPDEKLRKSLEMDAITALAKVDPKAALSRIQKMIPELDITMVGNGYVSEFTRELAEKDQAIAREFVESLPTELQLYPMVAVGSAWAKTDPVAALDWALAKGIDPTQTYRTGLGSSAASILLAAMSAQTQQTVDWLLALPEGNERDTWLQNALLQDRVKKDAELTRSIFDHLSADRQSRLAHGFGREIAEAGQFPDLQTWASWIPDESVRARAIGGALAGTFNNAPRRVEAMLAELPVGPIRDQTLAALTQTQTYSAPSAAAARALDIRDQTVRYDALDRLMNVWMNRDRQTAETWLNSQPDLPQEWINEWLTIKPLP